MIDFEADVRAHVLTTTQISHLCYLGKKKERKKGKKITKGKKT